MWDGPINPITETIKRQFCSNTGNYTVKFGINTYIRNQQYLPPTHIQVCVDIQRIKKILFTTIRARGRKSSRRYNKLIYNLVIQPNKYDIWKRKKPVNVSIAIYYCSTQLILVRVEGYVESGTEKPKRNPVIHYILSEIVRFNPFSSP